MKKLFQNMLLKLADRARRKRFRLEAKRAKELMLDAINLPRQQRKIIIKRELWKYRKQLDTPAGQYVQWWCDVVEQAGKAIDALRKAKNDPNLIMENIEFHAERFEKTTQDHTGKTGEPIAGGKVSTAQRDGNEPDQGLQGQDEQETKVDPKVG